MIYLKSNKHDYTRIFEVSWASIAQSVEHLSFLMPSGPPGSRHPPRPDPPRTRTPRSRQPPPQSRHPPGRRHTPPEQAPPPGAGTPPVNKMTDRCKNITLPQTSFAGCKKRIFEVSVLQTMSRLLTCQGSKIKMPNLPSLCNYGKHHYSKFECRCFMYNPLCYHMQWW